MRRHACHPGTPTPRARRALAATGRLPARYSPAQDPRGTTLSGAEFGAQNVSVTSQNTVCAVCIVSGQPIVVAGIRALLAECTDPAHT